MSTIFGLKCSTAEEFLKIIFRLTPPFAAAVIYMITLAKFAGAGPFWKYPDIENCRKHWWSTLLYVQNFVSPGELVSFQRLYHSVMV